MNKEKLMLKLNIKDYNNQLEKILAKKNFSEEIKNLLLSMLYKIEAAYDDYSLVNGNTKTKKEILEEILEIIEKNCKEIEIIKTKESKSSPEEGKIITYLNTRKMLYEIYQLKQNKFKVPDEYEIIKPSLEQNLNQGYYIDSSEIIRDFDGWSWNIVVEEIENLGINLVYQIIRILIGDTFLHKWQENPNQDYVLKFNEKLENKYETKIAEQISKIINQLAILNVTKLNEEEKNRLLGIQKKLQEEFNELDDKKKYLEKLAKEKKKIVEEIKKNDNIINNDKQLKEEFIARNELLDMNHRIFSLSDFAEIIEKEKTELMKKLNKCNQKMEPINFIKTKTEIEKKLAIIKELELQNNDEKTYENKVAELLKLVCEALEIQINKAEEKENIVKLIYKIRYYGLIYISENKQVKDIVDINNIQKIIITKACKQKIVTIFSKNIKENYNILQNILQTDIIELEHIFLKFIQKNDKTVLEIYDEENLSRTIELSDIKELNVKLNKKIRVFI